jgi:hypothetical protein
LGFRKGNLLDGLASRSGCIFEIAEVRKQVLASLVRVRTSRDHTADEPADCLVRFPAVQGGRVWLPSSFLVPGVQL